MLQECISRSASLAAIVSTSSLGEVSMPKELSFSTILSYSSGFAMSEKEHIKRSTSKIVEWWKKKRAKRTKNVLQCPMC